MLHTAWTWKNNIVIDDIGDFERYRERVEVCKLSTRSGESIADIEYKDNFWRVYFNCGDINNAAFKSFEAAEYYVLAMHLESEAN